MCNGHADTCVPGPGEEESDPEVAKVNCSPPLVLVRGGAMSECEFQGGGKEERASQSVTDRASGWVLVPFSFNFPL